MEKKNEVMIDGVRYVKESDIPRGKEDNPFMEVGKSYFIRTVTHYYTGRLIWVGDKEIAIEDVCWIADTGRFNEFLKSGNADEVEPFPEGSKVIIGRGSFIDMVEWKISLPTEVK